MEHLPLTPSQHQQDGEHLSSAVCSCPGTISPPPSEPGRTTSTTPIPAYSVPDEGSSVAVGVLIALPSEDGQGTERASMGGDEDVDVPEVCLGVMGCTVKGGETGIAR